MLQLDVGHARCGGLRNALLGRARAPRAERQMAAAFNARRPPARGPGEHLQPGPFARPGLSPERRSNLSHPAICSSETELCSPPEYIAN